MDPTSALRSTSTVSGVMPNMRGSPSSARSAALSDTAKQAYTLASLGSPSVHRSLHDRHAHTIKTSKLKQHTTKDTHTHRAGTRRETGCGTMHLAMRVTRTIHETLAVRAREVHVSGVETLGCVPHRALPRK